MPVNVRVNFYPDALAAAQLALEEQKKRARPHEAAIGVHEEDGTKAKRWYDGREEMETLVEVMVLHEYGDAGLPERSFLRSYFDANMGRFASEMCLAMQAEQKGDKDAVLRWVHQTHAEWKAWIEDGPFTPLSPRTIATKARYGLAKPATPLTATAQFVEAWRAKLDGRWA